MVEACDFLEVKTDLLNMRVQGNKLYIGEAPVLVVDMQTQENYVHYEQEDTALNYYYQTACEIAEETRFAREYGKRANRTKVVKTEK